MESYKVYNLSIFDQLSRLWASCVLCDQPSGRHLDLCHSCECELPWLASTCPRCAYPLLAGETECQECLKRAPLQNRTESLFSYDYPINRLIADFKYHQHLQNGNLLAELLAFKIMHSRPVKDYPAALIPIPLHRSKQSSRGYNQAMLLSKRLARRLGIKLMPGALLKTSATAEQAGLSGAEREHNLQRAFEISQAAKLPGHIALIDDVYTTGATTRAAAEKLSAAGVKKIEVWTLARTL